MTNRPIVAVYGSARIGSDDPRFAAARALGGALACFAVGVLSKPLILMLLPFFLFYSAKSATTGRVRLMGIVAGVIASAGSASG